MGAGVELILEKNFAELPGFGHRLLLLKEVGGHVPGVSRFHLGGGALLV